MRFNKVCVSPSHTRFNKVCVSPSHTRFNKVCGSVKFACLCAVHLGWCLCYGLRVKSCFGLVIVLPLYSFTVIPTEAPAKSAFLNKESVQQEVKAALSQKAVLSCEVADAKTEVKWYKDGKLLTSSKTVHAESKGKSRQLVMDSVERRDAGEYICEAGTEKLVFKVQVTGCGGDGEGECCICL
uniref:Ig-like domain-containing protein n=1 Tax=Monopterus albus TaxID=43700 RepID=A0A3Q3KBG6_MONAL